jgi:nucleotide-binding universal stress UspA family protein
MKILIAYDGSAPAQRMLGALVKHVTWFRDAPELTLLYVHPPLPHGVGRAWAGRDAVESYYREESDAVLASGRSALAATGLTHDVQQRVGDPATEIARMAESGGYEIIAMGKHGAGKMVTMVIGSVAQKVLARTHLPVLLLGDVD